MGDKGDKSNYRRGLGADELRLFKDMMRDVDPLDGKDIDVLDDAKPQEPARKFSVRPDMTPKKAKTVNKESTGLDRRTADRLRRGKMPIDARLDLHGMNQVDAHAALERFILSSYETGKRCVLVITGTGKPKASTIEYDEEDWTTPRPGVLKRRLPEWLAEPAMRPLILYTVPAQQKDGGEGAAYILLRRKRD